MWSRNKGTGLLAALAALLVADAVVLFAAARRPAPPTAFQAATGGIGLGASVSPAWSFFALDPRREGACENELFPVPGLPCPNPGHGTGVADLPPLSPARD